MVPTLTPVVLAINAISVVAPADRVMDAVHAMTKCTSLQEEIPLFAIFATTSTKVVTFASLELNVLIVLLDTTLRQITLAQAAVILPLIVLSVILGTSQNASAAKTLINLLMVYVFRIALHQAVLLIRSIQLKLKESPPNLKIMLLLLQASSPV